jgi:5-methylcytosine-specific restriction endonuclease McrA
MRRRDAKAAGLIRYDNGKPCPNGHLGDRFVSTGTCCLCLRIKTKAWQAIESNKAYNREYARKWTQNNRERKARTTKLWAQRNAEKLRLWYAKYAKSRRIERCMAETRRRARKYKSGGTHTADQIKELAVRQNHECPYCKASIRKRYHIDHIDPLVLGGSNGIKNIQLLCPPCNLRKSTKPPEMFAREIGLLI